MISDTSERGEGFHHTHWYKTVYFDDDDGYINVFYGVYTVLHQPIVSTGTVIRADYDFLLYLTLVSFDIE